MDTHLKLISESYIINTNMTGFIWLSKIFASLCFGGNASVLEGLKISQQLSNRGKWLCFCTIAIGSENLICKLSSTHFLLNIKKEINPFMPEVPTMSHLCNSLTVSMLRLLSSKAQKRKYFANHRNPVMLEFIGQLSLSTLG